jgi:hypothetical protein
MGNILGRAAGWAAVLIIGWISWAGADVPDTHHPQPQHASLESATLSDQAVRISKPDIQLETTFSLSVGLRQDSFEWSIAGHSDGTDPNVRSELTWSNVDSYQLQLSNRTCVESRLYFRADFNYAWIQDGTLRDSDYNQDNRNGEYSRSISETSGDQLWDLSAGVGYPFFFINRRLMVAPLVGGSLHKQNFRITDGRQEITWENGPTTESLAGLNTTYRAKWMGPWVGCDVRYLIAPVSKSGPAISVGVSMELHWAAYEGDGNWNLRNNLEHPKSFEHEADGHGIALGAELLIVLRPDLDLRLSAGYQDWDTRSGTDRKFLSDGTTSETRLHDVDWDTHSVMVGLTYHFF